MNSVGVRAGVKRPNRKSPKGPEVRAGEAALTAGRTHAGGDAKRHRPRGSGQSPTRAPQECAGSARARSPRSGVPHPARQRSFRAALGFSPAAEYEAAEGEAEPECADCEAADRKALPPRGQPLPAAESLTFFRRERFAAPLLADRASRS